MVIHQFNRIIRNKWIWGAFAIAISAFFAFDFLLTGGDSGERPAVLDGRRENRQLEFGIAGKPVFGADSRLAPRRRNDDRDALAPPVHDARSVKVCKPLFERTP